MRIFRQAERSREVIEGLSMLSTSRVTYNFAHVILEGPLQYMSSRVVEICLSNRKSMVCIAKLGFESPMGKTVMIIVLKLGYF